MAGIDDGAAGDLRRRCEAAEQELRLLRAVLDLVPDFFYVHDRHLRYRYANQAAADYFGVAKEALVGRLLRDVEPDPAQAAFYEAVCQRVMAEGRPTLTSDLPLRLRDGSVRLLRQYDVPFRDPGTGEPMLFGLSRDVTSEKALIDERVRRERAERELEIAKSIQQSILPRGRLDVRGFSVAGASVPSHYAAGDFYDWWAAPGGPAAICLGDVTGHGIGPAILAAACKAYGRAHLAEPGPLHRAVARLNRAMSGELADGRFVTLAAVRLDPATGAASLVSAGHGPVLRYTAATGVVAELDTHGLPLGIDPDAAFDAATDLSLAPGDALLILSDGLNEARDAGGELYGLDRVMRDVRRLAAGTAEAIARGLIDAAAGHCGAAPSGDDMTAVVIKRDA